MRLAEMLEEKVIYSMKKLCGFLPNRTPLKISAALFAGIMLALLAGCGGGGGGGGGGSSTPNEIFSGIVTNTASAGDVQGFVVRFGTSGPTTTTTSSGSFSLSVPPSDITGDDTLYLLDSSSLVVSSLTVINDSHGSSGLEINIGPPPTPPLIIKHA
jgi:hypothetical protein